MCVGQRERPDEAVGTRVAERFLGTHRPCKAATQRGIVAVRSVKKAATERYTVEMTNPAYARDDPGLLLFLTEAPSTRLAT